jgi:hypothetical protein
MEENLKFENSELGFHHIKQLSNKQLRVNKNWRIMDNHREDKCCTNLNISTNIHALFSHVSSL